MLFVYGRNSIRKIVMSRDFAVHYKTLGQLVMELPVFGRSRPEGKVLEAVGVFEAVKQHGKYETGQVRMASTTAIHACTHLHSF